MKQGWMEGLWAGAAVRFDIASLESAAFSAVMKVLWWAWADKYFKYDFSQ